MIDPASKLIKHVLNFIGIPSCLEVVVSSEVIAKRTEKALQFAWASSVGCWVRDLKLTFWIGACSCWIHLGCLEEYRDKCPLLLQLVSHVGKGAQEVNHVAAIIIVVAMISGFRPIRTMIGIIIWRVLPSFLATGHALGRTCSNRVVIRLTRFWVQRQLETSFVTVFCRSFYVPYGSLFFRFGRIAGMVLNRVMTCQNRGLISYCHEWIRFDYWKIGNSVRMCTPASSNIGIWLHTLIRVGWKVSSMVRFSTVI